MLVGNEDPDRAFWTWNTIQARLDYSGIMALGSDDDDCAMGFKFDPREYGGGVTSCLEVNLTELDKIQYKQYIDFSKEYDNKLKDTIAEMLLKYMKMGQYIKKWKGNRKKRISEFKKELMVWCTIQNSQTGLSCSDAHIRFSKKRLAMYTSDNMEPQDKAYLAYLPLTKMNDAFTISCYPVPDGAFTSGMIQADPNSVVPHKFAVKGHRLKFLPAKTVHTVQVKHDVDYLVIFIMIRPTADENITSFDLVYESDEPNLTFTDIINGV